MFQKKRLKLRKEAIHVCRCSRLKALSKHQEYIKEANTRHRLAKLLACLPKEKTIHKHLVRK